MSAQHRIRCPSCLSTLDVPAILCPQCGNPLTATSSARSFPAVLVIASLPILAVASVVWWVRPWQQATPGNEHGLVSPAQREQDASASQTIAPDHAPPAAPATPDTRRHPQVFRTLQGRTDDDRELPPALVLASAQDARAQLLLPLAVFPLSGGLKDADGAELHVVTWSLQGGFVLLSSTTTMTLESAIPGLVQGGVRCTVADEDGTGMFEVTVVGREEDGTALRLDRATPPACALWSADGKVVGYTLGGTTALSFDLVVPWLGRTGNTTVAAAAAEIRRTSPGHLQAEARGLLDEPRTPARIREAMHLLEQALALARDREAMEALSEDLRQSHRLLLESLAGTDAPGALAQVRLSLARFPSDPQLLLDGILLAIRAEDAATALWFHGQLSALSPDHARSAAERIGDGLGALAQRRLTAQRFQDALDILGPVVQICPRRADLRALYARALRAAGHLDLAAAEAAEAARLDPTHQRLAESFTVERTNPDGSVEIPFDPATRLIQTEVSFAGQRVPLVVDTGASLTTIPSAVADRLKLRKPGNRRVQVTTASGVVEGEVVSVPWLQIGRLRVTDVEAVVMDLPGTLSGKGLLGLNVLSRLHLEMDMANSRLILRQGRQRRGR